MKLNRRIITVMVSVLALFLVLVGYLTYFTIFRAPELVKTEHYKKVREVEKKIIRGTIYDRTGAVLAESKRDGEGAQKRVYPYGPLYAHTIGYSSRNYSKTNIEKSFDNYLLKTQSVIDVLKNRGKDSGEDALTEGANLSLTLDHSLMELAAELMGEDFGSVVAMNPVTGEIYCLYSSPTFDPNEEKLTEKWDELQTSAGSPFFARATQALYAPGSTFKIITAAAGIEEGLEDFTFDDQGTTRIGGREFKNAGKKAYGEINMQEAITVSSNVYFTQLSQEIGEDALKEKAEDFCITEKIDIGIPSNAESDAFDGIDKVGLASSAIGQGNIRVSPLNMTLVACAIANEGVIMKPYIVKEAFFEDGETIFETETEILSYATDSYTAEKITEYMVSCVEDSKGTGKSAKVDGIKVAGKTGTAENERAGKTHAWFVGFAPAENPQIAICVMKEYSGRGGGSVCAPIASKLIEKALETGLITE